MCAGGLSKHCTSAVTEPGPTAGSGRFAVAFQPVSLAKGLSDLIVAEPVVTKLPLCAVSPASHKAAGGKQAQVESFSISISDNSIDIGSIYRTKT